MREILLTDAQYENMLGLITVELETSYDDATQTSDVAEHAQLVAEYDAMRSLLRAVDPSNELLTTYPLLG